MNNLTTTGHSFTMPPCSSCSNNTGHAVEVNGREHASLVTCDGCGALLGRCYRGDSPVLMVFADGADDGVQPNVEATDREAVYFDLDLLGSDGVNRVHGWYDPASMKVVQFG